MSIKDCTLKIEYDMTEVYKGLDKLSDKTKKAAEGAMKDTVVNIANDAINGSPVDTGNNRRSIRYLTKQLHGEIFSTSGYGGFLETGTRFMGARPYFKPALDRHIGKFTKIMKEKLKW